MTERERIDKRLTRQKNLKGDIDELVDAQLFEMLREDPTLLQSLPPGAKATLIAQRLPKAAPVDQDYQKQLLSLESLLEDLPDTANLQRSCSMLRAENAKLRAKLVEEKTRTRRLNVKISRYQDRPNDGSDSFVVSLKALKKKWLKAGAMRQVCLDQYGLTVEEYNSLAADILEPLNGESDESAFKDDANE